MTWITVDLCTKTLHRCPQYKSTEGAGVTWGQDCRAAEMGRSGAELALLPKADTAKWPDASL